MPLHRQGSRGQAGFERGDPARGGIARLGAVRNGVMRDGVTRDGVTLLELLVVLVLMAITAGLVVPALRFPSTSLVSNGDQGVDGQPSVGLIATPEVDGVLATARRLALKRGEPIRLRVASDGVWAIAPVNGGGAIQNGRITQPLTWFPDLTIDAIGTCVLSSNVVPRAGARAWDALACRWREALP